MNIQALMKQAQSIQKDMLNAKNEIDNTEFIGESSLVKITVMGNKKVTKVEIKKDGDFSIEDLEMLEDMFVVAMNDATTKIDKVTEEKMGKYGNSLPGLF